MVDSMCMLVGVYVTNINGNFPGAPSVEKERIFEPKV